MSMGVSEFRHQFDTWEVYPRVYHFQKRYKDIYNRFCNITGKGPYSFIFKKSDLFDDLTSFKSMLENPLQIYVIGRENLDKDDLVVTSEPLQRAKGAALFPQQERSKMMVEDYGITLVVAHVQIKDVKKNGKKEVLDTIRHFASNLWKTTQISVDSLLIVCHTSMTYKAAAFEEFRLDVQEELEKSCGLSLKADHFIFGANSEMVSTKISEKIETQIIEKFYTMKEHLQSFVRNRSNFKMEKIDVVETEQLISAIQGFLKNGLGFVDILEDSQDMGERFEEVVLRHLMCIIRCAVLDPLSLKFNLTQDTCNQIAHEVKLEDKMKRSVSKNTRYHLSKLQQPCEEMRKAMKENNKWYRFPGRNFMFIAYPLRDDIRQNILQLEEDLGVLRRTVTVMKKMIFEINGNIKQSIIEDEVLKKPKRNKALTDELRKRILSIDGVYGTGTIYGEWEIHVQNENAKISVQELMTHFKVRHPVRVRNVLKEPKDLAGGQVEHGGVLESECPGGTFRSGTLGTFADSHNDDLYALTCGHVVYADDDRDHNIYIRNTSNERQLFAKSNPSLTVRSGNQQRALIDIAAVKVIDPVRPNCTKFLKDADGMLKSAVLVTENVVGLNAPYIFKHGAASNLTEGLVCSEDYSIAAGLEGYIVLIASPPGCADDETYAKPGDSGSVNCMPDVDKNKTVKVVSMLSGGGLELAEFDEQLYFSFQLSVGLDTLRDRDGGIELNLPSTHSDRPMF
ncbi:uncharacterized protein LOC128557575 [Mercenaria mercenaria]|uniref:uncharacterized protein LOC128557575 n=1 Tax=Mercenaria mercenaria TaxID=6596 RepID=UPI00234F13B6|nr:uncharacterized protein LOC128557575 [Mercenaria mercenaria]